MTPLGESRSDLELWELSRADDSAAFGCLFERHATKIYNYCFRATGNWAAAEDLLSLTFLEAWRRREKELQPGHVLPWIYGIATNIIRNRNRSERRFAAALRRVPVSQPESDFADHSNSRLDDERQMQKALELLAQLPSDQREAFVLCACMEVSYDDAALALAVPVGTVRSRLSRARARLRELEFASGHIESREPAIEEALGR